MVLVRVLNGNIDNGSTCGIGPPSKGDSSRRNKRSRGSSHTVVPSSKDKDRNMADRKIPERESGIRTRSELRPGALDSENKISPAIASRKVKNRFISRQV